MITIIDIVPQALSGETNQDSEPNIAVNPANPKQIVATAFTPDPLGGSNAPIYLSTDGGTTWSLNTIVPSAGSLGTGDITTRFTGTSNRLFSSILDGGTGRVRGAPHGRCDQFDRDGNLGDARQRGPALRAGRDGHGRS